MSYIQTHRFMSDLGKDQDVQVKEWRNRLVEELRVTVCIYMSMHSFIHKFTLQDDISRLPIEYQDDAELQSESSSGDESSEEDDVSNYCDSDIINTPPYSPITSSDSEESDTESTCQEAHARKHIN